MEIFISRRLGRNVYIYYRGFGVLYYAELLKMEVFPVISLKLLEEDDGEEIAKLSKACQDWGVFMLVDHGIPRDTMDAIAKSLKAFFDLPQEEKNNFEIGSNYYSSKEAPPLTGYKPKGQPLFQVESIKDEPKDRQEPHCWIQQLFLPCLPETDKLVDFWPEKPTGIKGGVKNYIPDMARIGEKLLRSFGATLGLKDETFIEAYGGEETVAMMLVANCMPQPPRGTFHAAPKHTDKGGVTILYIADGLGGLQVLKDGEWKSVPSVDPYALVVNTGDLMQVLCNGRHKSVVHRVVHTGETERLSLACGYNPDLFVKLGPVASLVDEQHPRLYSEGRYFDFLESFKLKPMTCFEFFNL